MIYHFLYLFYTECKIGYKSIDGKPCVACPVGFYGQKCRERCICQKNERYLIDLAIEIIGCKLERNF